MTAHVNLKHAVKGKACQGGPEAEKNDYVPNQEPGASPLGCKEAARCRLNKCQLDRQVPVDLKTTNQGRSSPDCEARRSCSLLHIPVP